MKPMTFEEWYDSDEQTFGQCWDAARIGMISEDGTIRIPPESEWPELAKSVVLSYSTLGTKEENEEDSWGLIKHIPRTTPKWVPKVGESVFYLVNVMNSGFELGHIAVEACDFECDTGVMRLKPSGLAVAFEDLKPFNPAYIGKPWSEIPGGNE